MSRAKGDRHETECKNLLGDLGYTVHKKVNNRYDSSDIFALFDLIAVRQDRKPVFIQVKTNGTEGELGNTLRESRDLLKVEHVDLEYWIKYDYRGWRVLRSSNGNDWEQVVNEANQDCTIGSGVKHNYEEF